MSSIVDKQGLETAHVLFLDVVGYTTLWIDQQPKILEQLQSVVSATKEFQQAKDNRLIPLPTGDGIALVYFRDPLAPIRCATEISKALLKYPDIQLRMGIHSGPVYRMEDINTNLNVAGGGINLAQRVMDCGDAGHILLSKHAAEDLSQFSDCANNLHDLGEITVKHGLRLHVYNFYTTEVGNPNPPAKFRSLGSMKSGEPELSLGQSTLEITDQLREDTKGVSEKASYQKQINQNKSPENPSKRSRLKAEVKIRRDWLILATVILLSIIGFCYWLLANRTSVNNTPITSVAVLPFQIKSSDVDTEYLSVGLANSLNYRLSRLPNRDLKVSPMSSVIQFSGKNPDPQEVGKKLSVDAVMMGHIDRLGDTLTIGVNLIDVRNNNSQLLWEETYERKLSELLVTQQEIATDITVNLKLTLSSADQKALAKQYANNSEAEVLYMKGRYQYAKRTKVDSLRAIEYFRDAIKLDPNFALAYVALADSLNSMPGYPYLSPKEAFPQAKAAALKALEIDPTLAEAHSALAYSLTVFDWNWVEAEREFKIALKLNPNVAEIHFRYGYVYLLAMGPERINEAISEVEKAVELERLSLINSAGLATVYMYAKQYDKALIQAKSTYDFEPNFVTGRIWLSDVYNARGMYKETISLCEDLLRDDPTSQSLLHAVGYAYAKSGRRREAEKIIKTFRDISKTEYIQSYYVASIYTALGEYDKAFVELEQAYRERDWALPRLKAAYVFESIHDDPRFADLVKRIGLP